MLTLLQFNLPLLGVALLIGVATGAWMFRRRPHRPDRTDSSAP